MRISVCVGLSNRLDNILSCLIKSLNNCINKENIILSVFDCGISAEQEIQQSWSGELLYSHEDVAFSRTYSLNKAVEQTFTEYIFLCDTDMTLPVDFFSLFFNNVSKRTVWFPTCFSLYEHKPAEINPINGYWRDTGYGMAGFYKSDFYLIGKLDLQYKVYGAEDNDLFNRCHKHKLNVIRENCVGLFHNWHPIKKFGK